MKLRAYFYYIFIPFLLLVSLFAVSFSFNVGKSVGKVSVDKLVASPVFKNYDDEKLLLFFGYVGCIDVCTPKLQELADIYEKLSTQERDRIGVLFITLSPLDDSSSAETFAKIFHQDFEGLYVTKALLQDLQKEFNVYMAPSLTQKDTYDHSAFVYLLHKTALGYKLISIYTDNTLQHELILTDLKKS